VGEQQGEGRGKKNVFIQKWERRESTKTSKATTRKHTKYSRWGGGVKKRSDPEKKPRKHVFKRGEERKGLDRCNQKGCCGGRERENRIVEQSRRGKTKVKGLLGGGG